MILNIALSRFYSKVDKKSNNENDCHIWLACKNTYGYGQFWYDKKLVLAHRFIYCHVNNIELSTSQELDHICKNRACVNPIHLRIVSKSENVLSGNGITAINARKTHCKRGHEFTPENTFMNGGTRHCKICAKFNRRLRWMNKSRRSKK